MGGEITTRFAVRRQTTLVVEGAPGKAGEAGKAGEKGAPGKAGSGGGVSGFLDLGAGTTFELDFAEASHFRIAPTADFSVTIVNGPAADEAMSVVLEVVAAEGFELTLPGDGTWGGLGPPEFSTDFDLLTITMRNGEPESFWAVAVPGTL